MTKAKLAGVLTSLIAVLALALTVRAEQEKSKPAAQSQTYAVLVGVSDYADKQIKPRPHAEADVKAFYDVFTNKDYLGLDNDHVRLLLGTADEARHSQPATRDNIIKALRWAVNSAGSKDLILFTFVGQGAPLGERTCYFASDSTFKDRLKNAVAAGDIEHELDKLKKTSHFCAFIDVNLKGFDPGKDTVPEANVSDLVKQFFGADDNAASAEEKPIPMGRVLFLASNRVIDPIELDEHGLFTQVLLDGLKGAADKEGYEPDGVVTVDELMEYVDKEYPGLVRTHGKTKQAKEQLPVVVGARSSHFTLTKNPAVAAKVQERLDKFAKLVDDNKIAKDRAAEGRDLLSQMPKLEAYRALRKKYQDLADGKLAAADFEQERTKILDGMKLKRSAALEFASKVIDATEKIQKDYVKELKQEDLVVWAIRGLYRRIEERIPADLKERLDNAKGLGEKELTALLADARGRLGKREDLDNHKDIDIALVEMLHNHTDPYTTYIDAEYKKQFEQDMTGQLYGIGVQIRKDSATDMLLVVTPIKDSPAYKARPLNLEVGEGEAGLKTGDIIAKVTRQVDSEGKPLDPPEVLSTKGMLIGDAVKKIKGKAGTNVKLTVQRKGIDKPLEFEITRDRVDIESVVGVKRHEDDTWDYMIDPDSKIAYIRLNAFTQNTAPTLLHFNQKKQLGGLLPMLTKKGIKGLVLDLRNNPGGLLKSAVDISDMFIDDGLIVKIKDRAGHVEPHYGNHDFSHLSFPMVCLINGYSASGSEIVAACLQDHHRALIVGERSYGKGSVQNVQSFDDGELKITIASFWRPSGKNLNKSATSGKEDDEWGVMPDKGYLVKLSRKERDELAEHLHNQEIIPRRDLPAQDEKPEFKDRQLDKALEYLRGQIKTAAQISSKKAG